ncbi:IS5/IS1182 family transposase (plasmid) [Alloyangia pacifica]|uniref:IS5/IS1182 family transposase n=1 Tax=Alloyangia pacifica TaxID=311180 RepID=A0A2U8HPZ4_9RHOB|nr:IS5 family transposase [Alloyangia pacifica]AWI86865.1 IS5/IS1182 family transposase [Alloyangia pacifica]
MSKPEPKPARYRTTNWSAYNAALTKRGSLLIWLDKEMAWHAPHEGRPGRPPVFSDAAIQFCLSIKVLLKLPLRQTAGMVASLLRLAGLDWPVPDFSTLCRRQKTLKVQIPYRRAGGPLNLLVDSTGIKFLGDGEWQARKHGLQGRRQWRKVHLAMDTATSDIRAVEFTPSREGDSPVLPDLLDQIPDDEDIGTVTADGAYDTRRCHSAIIAHGGTAIIPIRKNGRPWKGDCPASRARNETLRATRHYSRAFWKRWTGYHIRSRAEARMRCLKAFGERIAARDPDRQTAEIHIRVALMNRFNALGTAEIVRVT